jgi:type IV pilus assembly protein PilY1
MSLLNTRCRTVLGAALLTVCVSLPAIADDIEIYRGNSGARPNVLFVLDTSGSMDTTVLQTPPAYDPSTTYAGTCVAGRIYYTTNNGTPSCGSNNWFPASSNTCKASFAALVNIGGSGAWPALGNSRQKAAQHRNDEWRSIASGNSGSVECEADDGVHGRDDASTAGTYIRENSTGWSTTDRDEWSEISNLYRFFTPNYLNYANGAGQPIPMTRLEIVRNVAITLASTLQGVNLGLMRYSTTAEGGYVLNAVEDINANRSAILATLNAFSPTSGSSYTPLSETYYEAARYLTGRSVQYGNTSAPGISVPESRLSSGSNTYKTPITNQCQKNFIVYLTDGAPTQDHNANASIGAMIGGACQADPIEPYHDSGWTLGSGICMDDLANWLNTSDLSAQVGDQTVQTYMIGFGDSVAASAGYLNTIARAGGTEQAYTAGDVPTLTSALQAIFEGIQDASGTFVTPSVSVNAFNRAQADSDLFFSLFKVSAGPHWLGNLKKYELDGATIVDVSGQNAVNSLGFFDSGARSFWSPLVDGNDVAKGGAVSQMPDPAARKIYSYLSTEKQLSHSSGVNFFSTANTTITDAVVGSGAATTGCSALCQTTINWARGLDVRDRDRDGSTTDAAHFMGDPLHGRPALIGYGGSPSSPDPKDVVVFVPTNDGFLHAIAGHTGSGGGQELWAFIPPELLPRLHSLYENTTTSQRTYGLDGDVRVMKLDTNQDGIVDAGDGDRVWIFFGMRMGGDRYYALDVTDRNSPKLMWNIGPTELPGLGQSWSAPAVTRVRVGSANDNAEKLVLVFGGGYDLGQEVQPYSADDVGNRIFMVDAETGKRLWHAGPSGGVNSPDLVLANMTNAIAGRITVIDTDGDLFSDRMYAADLGGRVWRFDITNGNAAGSLVAGGVIARLGAADNGTPPAADARRLYNAPDVSLVQRRRQQPYFNIALGSGHRGHPLDLVTADRFYSIRDKQPYARLTQAQYDALAPIVESDLRDITSDPVGIQVLPGDPGWRYELPARSGHLGEKVLAESTTVNNVILFPTFQPLEPSATDPCFPTNVNRVYAINVDGNPALDFNNDGRIDNDDTSVELAQTGIVGDINVALVRTDDANASATPQTVCLAGVEVLSKCVGVGGTIRTFWHREDAD